MIEVRGLKKSFGPQPILDGVDFRIEKGESVVIIGRSGGGKSVLLKHLIGLLMPDSGEVLIDGESIIGMSERDLLRVRSRFGMVFQGAALFDSMTVAENVGFPLVRQRKLTPSEIATRVSEALEMVDLPGTETKRPSELSGGMRKRIALARTLILRPEIRKAASAPARIRALYQLLWQRPVTTEELRVAEEFLAAPPASKAKLSAWEKYAQVLLLSNELLFVD